MSSYLFGGGGDATAANQTDIEAKIDILDSNVDTLVLRAQAEAGSNATTVVCSELADYGEDYFNTGWWIYILQDAGGAQAAPEGEWRKITNYVEATGTFTTEAFSAAVATDDYFMVVKDEFIVKHWERQAEASLNQGTPTQNTWYDVLPETSDPTNVIVIAVCVEDTDEDLEFRATIDGNAHTEAWTATADSVYYMYYAPAVYATTIQIISSTSVTATSYLGYTFRGHSVHLELRKTSANGAGNLNGICLYELMKPMTY